MSSIRGRLLVGLIGTILPLILFSYVLVYFFVERAMSRNFDANLAEKLNTFSRMAEWDEELDEDDEEAYADFGDDPDNLLRFEFAELALPEYQVSGDAEYYQVWGMDGTVYARSPSLAGGDLPFRRVTSDSTHSWDLTLPDGRPGRLAARRIVASADEEFTRPVDTGQSFVLGIARSTRSLRSTLALLRAALAAAGALTVAAAGILIWFVTRRGLRPLDDIGDAIQEIGEDDLGRRIAVTGRPSELAPVCQRLNEMLDRLNDVFERERQFTSNVAHELRTPVAELRTLAEVSAQRPHATEADRRSYRDTIAIASRMERLVSTLLELSRCSSGQIVKDVKRTTLAKLVKETWKPFCEAARGKGLSVQMTLDESMVLDTDPVLLGTILSNLFSNAVVYTPRDGTIAIECRWCDDTVELSVANTAPGLTAADIPHLFDTFWRKDGPDTHTDDHLGLGLSLVRALAALLGIAVEARMASPRVLQFRMVHPA